MKIGQGLAKGWVAIAEVGLVVSIMYVANPAGLVGFGLLALLVGALMILEVHAGYRRGRIRGDLEAALWRKRALRAPAPSLN